VARLKVMFMGAGTLACPLLEGLLAAGRDDVVAVVTPPDRAAGRGLQCRACPLKPLAARAGLPVLAPEDVNDDAVLSPLMAFAPDVIVVACFGQFLKRRLLDIPRLGAINVHPSLLPRYRGASPIQWTLANGEAESGVTVLYVTPKMDAGDVLAQERVAINPDEAAPELEARLAVLGASLLVRVLDDFRAGRTQGIPQDESLATYAPKLAKEDGQVDWTHPADVIRNRLRGFFPWPGAYTLLPNGTLLKIHAMHVEAGHGAPGTVLDAGADGPLIAAGTGAVRLTQVQPAGRKSMPGGAFLRGHRLQPGDRLGG